MDRLTTIIEVDLAIEKLAMVRENLIDMACTYTMTNRLDNILRQLGDLRVDILQADLPGEQEVIFIPK